MLSVVWGGSGYIGAHLVDMLASPGHLVRVISRYQRFPRPAYTEWWAGRISDRKFVRHAVHDADTVYQLATAEGDTAEDYGRDIVEGTRLVVEGCLSGRAGRLVYTSSISALYLGGCGTINEDSGCDPEPEKRNSYARAKIAAERLLLNLHQSSALPVVIARPGIVVGGYRSVAGCGVGRWTSDLHCLGWGAGTNPAPLVLVEDVARALVKCGSVPDIEGKCFHLVGDVRLSPEELLRELRCRTLRNFRFYRRSLFRIYAANAAKWMLKRSLGCAVDRFPAFRDLSSRTFKAHVSTEYTKKILNWQPVADREEFLASCFGHDLAADQSSCQYV
jgi:nucleoside-diphosphate-sugar epimerase